MFHREKILPLSRFVIYGNSMLPTLNPKTSIISFNWYYLFQKPRLNEIVVAKVNNLLIIKRITKLNGKKIWLEGDNKKESTDSRNFGWVSKSQIIGKIVVILH